MKLHRLLAFLAFSTLAMTACAREEKHVYIPPEPFPHASKNEVVVKLSPSPVERTGLQIFTFDAKGYPKFSEPKPVKMVKGEFSVEGESVSFYLPAYGPYSITSDKQHSFQNTSTALSVDANGNEDLERTEVWYSSMPIRLGDEMFDVKKIDSGSTWILLSKSAAPLGGLVAGKPCPPFKFTFEDGKQVTLADYKGKWLLLDVWSMT